MKNKGKIAKIINSVQSHFYLYKEPVGDRARERKTEKQSVERETNTEILNVKYHLAL